MRLASKVAINEKSTILVQFWWNFIKCSQKWGSQLDKVWARLDQNCRFFINSQFWGQSHFLWISLYETGKDIENQKNNTWFFFVSETKNLFYLCRIKYAILCCSDKIWWYFSANQHYSHPIQICERKWKVPQNQKCW